MDSSSSSLPAILSIDAEALQLAVLICLVVECLSLTMRLMWGRVGGEWRELKERQAVLKVEVKATNYPEKFVENAKLQRQLLKVEKAIEKCEENRVSGRAKADLWVRRLKYISYGSLVFLNWGRECLELSPSFLSPLQIPAAGPLQGVPRGSVSVVGTILLFQLGFSSLYKVFLL
jgi:hypothetical protein